ncbi:hypothetical protein HHI_04815 [Hyphomonas hirschiana VP5]|uniref:Uncharacterized protein n=1 Tax=Hyphomonas hirschiana VP5 TaxID=1280951 RepID=A0A059FXQ0_9PROT|nr:MULTISPECIES: hypothetical protein [Hyphomonas]KCZ95449.1 hypothetical protein HHI_04815 [Hyphomonas hirschiana VP5]
MASTPSTLTDEHRELAIDASVLINLLGTGEAEAVLLALARPIIIASEVYREVKRDPFTGTDATGIVSALETRGLVTRFDLDAEGTAHMLDLVSAPGSDALDDGEAATIALGARRRCCVVIDEMRGRRIANGVPIEAGVLGTLDILACRSVQKALGETRFHAAILSAARAARMRFPVEYGAWVETLLGEDEARSLPGLRAYYRTRR